MQFAIADTTGKISLWCYHKGTDEDGAIHFRVINGAWNGKYKDGTVYVEYTKASYPGYVVWTGRAKFHEYDYNDAMLWIQDQVDDPEYVMTPLEADFKYTSVSKRREHDDYDEIPF